MFSDAETKNDKLLSRAWLAMAAGLAFMFLLAALFQVVHGQVEQARLRQAQYSAAQTALSGCAASYSGAVRRLCMDQVNAGFTPYTTYPPPIETLDAQAGALAVPDARGVLQAAFAHH